MNDKDKETFQGFKNIMDKKKSNYFDRQGNNIDLMEWANKIEDLKYKIVKRDVVDRYLVSTVWIGLNMCIFSTLPIQIFETMIFPVEKRKWENDPLFPYQERYSTEEEALIGHEKAIKIAELQNSIEDKYEYQEIYSTEEDALIGHDKAVKMVQIQISSEDNIVFFKN